MGGNLYELIGVDRNSSFEAIKHAYHEKARRYHPDLNQEIAASEQFLEIQDAYEILKDPVKRQEYDSQLENEFFVQPVSRLRIISSRKAISRLDEDQLIYALMEIECLKLNEEFDSPKVHICLVIDQSTSMQGHRMDMVKVNVNRALSTLNSRDLVSVVTFSDSAQVCLPPTEISDSRIIESKISQISTSGATEIKKGLKAGIDLLWPGDEKNIARYLILLTDGHTYGDEEECYSLASQAAEQGIIISAMGFGHEWNETFLEKLTAKTGGSTVFVNSKEVVYHYLEKLFKSVDLIYAQKMTLFLERDPRVEMRFLFQLEPTIIQYSTRDNKIVLGDLFFGKKSLFLMEFLVHPLIKKDKDVELLSGQIRMELPAEEKKNARLFPKFILPIVDETVKDQPPDELVRALSKLTLYFMQERSREDVKIGSYVHATQRLNFLASHLLAEGEVRLANRVFSECQTIQKTHQFSLDGEKELKYGTKKLLALSNP